MTKNQILAEKIIVTFFEAAIAYLTVNQTNLSGNAKTTAIGAVGFGLSAAYNLLRESKPTLVPPFTAPTPPLPPLNGVDQLTGQANPKPPVV